MLTYETFQEKNCNRKSRTMVSHHKALLICQIIWGETIAQDVYECSKEIVFLIFTSLLLNLLVLPFQWDVKALNSNKSTLVLISPSFTPDGNFFFSCLHKNVLHTIPFHCCLNWSPTFCSLMWTCKGETHGTMKSEQEPTGILSKIRSPLCWATGSVSLLLHNIAVWWYSFLLTQIGFSDYFTPTLTDLGTCQAYTEVRSLE